MFDLGKFISIKINERGLSERKLASLIEVSNTTINRLVNNKIEEPSVDILRKIESILGLDEDYLVNMAYPKTVITSDELPEELKNLKFEYVAIAKELQENEIPIEKIKALIKLIKN